ncbi:hypothetical protein OGA60_004536 [Salmonella enterica]|nr:hypothetical protein [Salmonella enterica]EJY3384049.1 hypothetical protein [Salmonella enterica]
MSEGHGSASDTTAQYCAGFFFYDSEASQATVWRMVTGVSNGSSPPSLQGRVLTSTVRTGRRETDGVQRVMLLTVEDVESLSEYHVYIIGPVLHSERFSLLCW